MPPTTTDPATTTTTVAPSTSSVQCLDLSPASSTTVAPDCLPVYGLDSVGSRLDGLMVLSIALLLVVVWQAARRSR